MGGWHRFGHRPIYWPDARHANVAMRSDTSNNNHIVFAVRPTSVRFRSCAAGAEFLDCFPRLALVGCHSKEEVAKRVDDGWAVVSVGILCLMPIVFAEMLFCD